VVLLVKPISYTFS